VRDLDTVVWVWGDGTASDNSDIGEKHEKIICHYFLGNLFSPGIVDRRLHYGDSTAGTSTHSCTIAYANTIAGSGANTGSGSFFTGNSRTARRTR